MADRDTIMIVEDDADLRDLIKIAGERRSYETIAAGNGIDAKRLIENGHAPDLVVLDINMPGMDGFGFCRWLREDHPLVPVIFLSARAEEYDKIVALEIGGDDYLTKPFSMKELYARIQVSLRRRRLYEEAAAGQRDSQSITIDGVTMDSDRWTCVFRGRDVTLTVSEFRILKRLLSSPGMVVSRERLAEAAFPDDAYNLGRSVDVHVCRIRRKLAATEPEFDPIETVHQVGYKWKT